MKTKTLFVCQNCGTQSPRWVGKCPGCQNWNSFVEENPMPVSQGVRGGVVFKEKPVLLNRVLTEDEARLTIGITEFDRVLGGGIVPASVTLIGGDPGIGKSTLTLQVVSQLSRQGHKVLYVSGEESVRQTKMRADRLASPTDTPLREGLHTSGSGRRDNDSLDSLYIVNQVDLNVIKEYIRELKPEVIVIDSIQVVYLPEISSSPGSVSQVRESASVLTHLAKTQGIALFLIGHVTKEGMLAGPRVLEHIVDTVLYFEGERYTSYRVLRSIKNRFGSTHEMGIFEMTANGLTEVLNPSELFLSERPQQAPGSVVVPILEGSRPFLVEVQGLVSRSTFGMVRQKAQGFDANRLALLVAVLEKRLNLNLQDKDIFLNIVGGVKVMDPAADLAVVMAVASAFLDKPVPFDTVVCGEVGLSSEVRSVSQINLRVNEAEKLGFKKCMIPKNNLNAHGIQSSSIQFVPVETVKEALEHL